MISILLDDTSFQLRFNQHIFDAFETNTGVPQGDGLSPILFIIYLEAVLRDLADTMSIDHDLLDNMIAYADDCDFICDNLYLVDRILLEAPKVFEKWSLQMNSSKTELTHIEKRSNRQDEYWRNVKKLGSLLGDIQDLSRRKHLAKASFHRMWKIWVNQNVISEQIRLRIYNAYVRPVLLYNCGTWGLTQTALKSLESFHRGQLRRVIGIYYPKRISCKEVYARCKCLPLRFDLLKARWKCFGHILRRPDNIPANLSMKEYFETNDSKWKGKSTMCLPLRLHEDLKLIGLSLNKPRHLERMHKLAQDRDQWDELIQKLHDKTMVAYEIEEKTRLSRRPM